MSICAATALVAILALAGYAEAELLKAHGVVFNDRNGNGVRERSEPGVGHVCVSNGRDVVQTDSKGRYELRVDDSTIVFVIKPRHWRLPVDENNFPKFHYIHKPAGSPPLKYAGIAPTGPLPDSLDFPLYRHRESRQFRALFFGDPQPHNQREVDYVSHDVVEELIGFDAAFGTSLGDVVSNDLSCFQPINRVVGQIGIPWHNVQGNHDTNQDVPDDTLSSETYRRLYGPEYYAFNCGKVHFIILDDVCWDGDGYHGEIGEKQLGFIRNDLAFVPKDRLIVLLMHIPLLDVRDRADLFALLETYPHTFSASAHWHTLEQYFLNEDAGWHGHEPHHHFVAGAVCGSWWCGAPDEQGIPPTLMADGAPNGYSILTFDGVDYAIEYKAARRPADYQMTIYTPEVAAAGQTADMPVVANVFLGSERSTVEMQLDSAGAWIPMQRTPMADPYLEQVIAFENKLPENLFRRTSKPKDSLHIWTAPLPDGLDIGVHRITVRTTDMFGHTYTAHRLIRVE